MEAIIQVSKDGKYFIAVDLITSVADQGLTKEEAIANLKKGLKERYEALKDLASHSPKTVCLDIEVEKHAKAPVGVC